MSEGRAIEHTEQEQAWLQEALSGPGLHTQGLVCVGARQTFVELGLRFGGLPQSGCVESGGIAAVRVSVPW